MADHPARPAGRDLLSADLIAERSFAIVRRGFDREAVTEFLRQVAEAVRTLHVRIAELEEDVRSAEHRALHPEIDEDVLMERVGEETAAILRSARAAAGDLRTHAADDAARITEEARQRAQEIRGEAEAAMAQRGEEADRAAEEIRGSARAAAEQLVERARQEVESLRQMAEQERRLTVEGAQSVREKILADLARRRRVATVQIEQLRAGRERLLESYGLVRRTLEEVQADLERADSEARAAADRAAQTPVEEEILPDLSAEAGGVVPPPEPVPSVLVNPPAVDDEPGPGGLPVNADHLPGDGPAAGVEVAAEVGPEEGAAAEGLPAPDADDAPTEPVEVTAPAAAAPPPEPEPAPARPEPEPERPLERETVSGRRLVRKSVRPGSATDARPSEALRSGVDDATQGAAAAEAAARADVVTAPDVEAASRVTNKPGETGESLVEGLFARIKAGREESVERAREVLAADAADADDPSPVVAAGPAGPEAPAGADAEDDTDAGVVRSAADEALLERRDSALGTLDAALTRKLKRALQDEQNDLLDRLRGRRGVPGADELLGSPAEHRRRYIDAARPHLDQAAKAGGEFAVNVIRDQGLVVTAPKRGPKVDDLAGELAGIISDQLRPRVEQAIEVGGRGDDASALVESLGAAYRETKTQRIERSAGDQVTAAFSRGVWTAAGDRVPLRWIVEDPDGPCADCDDNALAGALPRHEGFPTGQAHPPAHAGCRCLIVPDGG